MSNATPTEPSNDVITRTIDMNAEVKKRLGAEWGAASPDYEFSNGKKFVRHTEDSGIYKPQT